MSAGVLRSVLRHLRGRPPLAGGPADADLLRRYAADRDEFAFDELVRRHGPLVWGVCRRALPRHADAEDAFQATFLVLAKNPRAVKKPGSLGCWLHGVAHRVAHRMRSKAAKSPPAGPRPTAGESPADRLTVREFLAALDDELARLPESVRRPLVLCYLQEQTQDEAARQLGISLSTLKRRLDAGRETLRERLARRGVDLSVALATAGLAAVPAEVTAAAVRVAIDGVGCGAVSVGVLQLAEGVGRTMWQTKARAWAVGLVVAGGAVTGTGTYTHTGFGQTGGAGGGGPVPGSARPIDGDTELKELERLLRIAEVELSRAQATHENLVQVAAVEQRRDISEQVVEAFLLYGAALANRDAAQIQLDARKVQLAPAGSSVSSTIPGKSIDQLRPDAARAEVKKAEAELAQAEVSVRTAEEVVRREPAGLIARAELRKEQAKLALARARLELARRQAARVTGEVAEEPPAPPVPPALPPQVVDRTILEIELKMAQAKLEGLKGAYAATVEQARHVERAAQAGQASRAELASIQSRLARDKAEVQVGEYQVELLRRKLTLLDQPATSDRRPAGRKPQSAAVPPELKQLREEKLKAARATLDMLLELRRVGAAPRDIDLTAAFATDIYTWSKRVLQAEQELDPTAAGRTKAAQAHLERMKQLETAQVAASKAGTVRPSAASAANYYRLEAEEWVKQAGEVRPK